MAKTVGERKTKRAAKNVGGRPRESRARMKKRGHWRVKAEEKGARAEAAPKARVVRKAFRMSEKRVEKYCRTLVPGYDAWATADKGDWFDAQAARAAVKFFHCELCHVKGEYANTGFYLEPWEVAIVGNLFGWMRKDGTRRYQKGLLYVPRKNGKTPIAAGVILYSLFEDDEPGAEIYGAAATFKQASLVFTHARGMVTRNEKLAARCRVYGGQRLGGADKSIQLVEHPDNIDDLSAYLVVARDSSGGMEGYNANAAVIDELHAQPDRELVDALETAMSGRRQPLLLEITTADFERESICNEEHEYACNVRDGKIKDRAFLPVIYEASAKDDWTDEKLWWRVNPNLGVSKKLDYMRAQCRKAKESVGARNSFLRRELNVKTQQSVLWLPMEDWAECVGSVVESELVGKTCFGGLDLASSSDITAFVLGFPIDGRFKLLCRFWCPEEVPAKKRREQETRYYRQWIERGLIRTTPGNVTDYDFIRKAINEDADRFGIKRVGIDRSFQGAQLCTQLQGDGLDVVPFGQGFPTMAAPTLAFETAVKARTLEHGGHLVLDWMAGNVAVEVDTGGRMRPTKSGSDRKIDGIVCGVMALALASLSDDDGPSVYETEGLCTLG